MSQTDNNICKDKVFRNIFETYAKDLRNFMFYRTQNMPKADDLMQEAFVKLWDNCNRVNIDKVKSYLFTTANNLFLNQVKHEKVVRNYENQVQNRSNVETPEFIAIEKEFMDKIQRTIESLPKKQREVFVMSRIEKKKYKEISELLEISVKAVEKRMHRALITIREEIGDV